MAKVFLLSVVAEGDTRFPPFAREDLERMLRCAEKDVFKEHSLVNDPHEADLIIFVERAMAAGRSLEHVRKHPIQLQFKEKCFVCNSRYFGVPLLPGVYGQVRKQDSLLPGRIKSGHYTEIYDKPHIRYDPSATERQYLYSFVGAVSTWPVLRGRLSQLQHPRGLFVDTSKAKSVVQDEPKEAERNGYFRSYVDIINSSKFVLCPRGDAPSSMRLFEAMKMGRVPVVIADEFLYPEGPRWDTFSIHVAEKDIASIPEILEAVEGRAEGMGHLAREAYEEWFGEDVYFHRMVEWCLEIQGNQARGETLLQYVEYLNLLRPLQLRHYTAHKLSKIRKAVASRRAVGSGAV